MIAFGAPLPKTTEELKAEFIAADRAMAALGSCSSRMPAFQRARRRLRLAQDALLAAGITHL